ncbi:hypothetical protein LAU42_07080 [Macrococcus armenti]|uniref:hypothetical protein n=1 Tax=Macrococcus armenti TaxID=2875764 RepID=UPI001CCD4BB3|nr:hypothetical protein [Macrococcus armenti]UBH21558.1 hypothetical protein LAU42_07080 [Macrococcus armenti]
MINKYDNLNDEIGVAITGRTKLFIKKVDDNGNIESFAYGIAFTVNEPGTVFIVDEYLIDQIDKIKFVDGDLVEKEGMSVSAPEKSKIELEKEELLKRLAELESK